MKLNDVELTERKIGEYTYYEYIGDLSIYNNTIIDYNIAIKGNLNCEGNLDCRGNLNCGGYLNCRGNLNCGGNLYCRGNLNCKVLYWSCMSMPKFKTKGIFPVYPQRWQFDFWNRRLDIGEFSCCYNNIFLKVYPRLKELLTLDKWSETERFILESHVHKAIKAGLY